jgi:hypothetical protein
MLVPSLDEVQAGYGVLLRQIIDFLVMISA